MTVVTASSGQPMGEINTTPLIDVMLVLLIMIIMTIPISTNSLEYDLPTGQGVAPNPVKNVLVVTRDDRVLWNEAQITDAELAGALAGVSRMRPEPEVQFRPEAQASYDRTAKVLQIVEASRVTKFGFVGNEQYREFDRAD